MIDLHTCRQHSAFLVTHHLISYFCCSVYINALYSNRFLILYFYRNKVNCLTICAKMAADEKVTATAFFFFFTSQINELLTLLQHLSVC